MFARLTHWLCDRGQNAQTTCPFCESDLLKQAKQQLTNGHYVGSVATARCNLVESLRLASRESGLLLTRSPRQRTRRPKARWMAETLFANGHISRSLFRRTVRVIDRTSSMLDRKAAPSPSKTEWVLDEVRYLSGELNDLVLGKEAVRHDKPLAAKPDQSANL